jgi:hypothetical protein
MYASAVDEASARLRELRHEERLDMSLSSLAIGLALAATQVRPALALPLFLGGLAVWLLGLRALWRRWDLVDSLAGERDAYVIPEVLAYASRETTMERRHSSAELIRSRLKHPAVAFDPEVLGVAAALEALACELDDHKFALDPVCAVACTRLLSDLSESRLHDPALWREDLRSRVWQIRSGFVPAGTRTDRTHE